MSNKAQVNNDYIHSPLDYFVVKVGLIFQALPILALSVYYTAKLLDYLRSELISLPEGINQHLDVISAFIYRVASDVMRPENFSVLMLVYFGLWGVLILFDKHVVRKIVPDDKQHHIDG